MPLVEQVPIESIVHDDRARAHDALKALGSQVIDDFELQVRHPVLGMVLRCFGMVPNVLVAAAPRDPLLYEQLQAMIQLPENADIRRRLTDDPVTYTPLNKRTVRRLTPLLHRSRVHLPWAFRPMNFDFGAVIEDAAQSGRVTFQAFYSRAIDVAPDGRTVTLKRVFSLPVRGSAHGTWQEPIFDEMLDADVGMFLEANVLLDG